MVCIYYFYLSWWSNPLHHRYDLNVLFSVTVGSSVLIFIYLYLYLYLYLFLFLFFLLEGLVSIEFADMSLSGFHEDLVIPYYQMPR